MNSVGSEINIAAFSTEPAQKLLRQASKLFRGLSERDLGQVINYIERSGQVDVKSFEEGLEEVGFVKTGKFTRQEQKPAHGKEVSWQDKIRQPLARMYKLGKDKITSMEVRMLPSVREYVDAMAAHKGMHAQEYVEHLIVDDINRNTDHLKHGEQLLKEFSGSLTRIKRHAQEEELARLRETVGAGSSPRR